MNRLTIKTYPAPCLRKKIAPVTDFNEGLPEIVNAMAEIMYVNQGIGLAAPQVGLSSGIIVIDCGDGLMPLINAEVLERSTEKYKMEEGCLSLPGITVTVSRPRNIKVRAYDITGKPFTRAFSGLSATVIQHEMDHLNGRLIIDYLNPLSRLYAGKKLSRQTRVSHLCV